MPASTLDPVNAAIRSSLSKTASETNLDIQLAGATKKALLADIEFEAAGSYQSHVLDKLKTKYIVLKSPEPQQISGAEKMGADETLTLAKHELYPLEAVQLGWSNNEWVVGAGMVNMGNTCYLNSTLQALFHVPALVNWLLSDKQHMLQCENSGGGLCIICAMRKTLHDSQQHNVNSIRPYLIFNKLRVVCRNLIPGRQEDAHEFLRYLVEAMEKAYLSRFKNHSEFDSRTKETTPLNQILGGYLRSAVRCLQCGHVSTTFQHFQDLLLDIRKAQTIEEALEGYFSREKLDDESYHCESCKKKVPATKQFSLERAPMVLCIQLKRFSVSNNKITKHVQFRQRLELTKYARHRPSAPLVYRFVALVTHMGPTVGCGHYTAVAQAPCGNYYQFDDSMVRPISHQAVFNTNAYMMLYELECPPFPQKTQNGTTNRMKTAAVTATSTTSSSNSNSTYTSTNHLDNNNKENSASPASNKLQLNGSRVMYGPELPPKMEVMAATSMAATIAVSAPSTSTAVNQNGIVSSSSGNRTKLNGSSSSSTHQSVLPSSSSSSSSSSSDSEPESQQEKDASRNNNNNNNSNTDTSAASTTVETAKVSSFCENQKSKSPKTFAYRTSSTVSSHGVNNSNSFPASRSCSSSSASNLSGSKENGCSPKPRETLTSSDSNATTPTTNNNNNTQSVTKLVPYDVDDDENSSSEEFDSSARSNQQGNCETSNATTTTTCATDPAHTSNGRIPTKATSGDWQVTSSTDHGAHEPSNEGKSWDRNNKNRTLFPKDDKTKPSNTVNELLKMSHCGYSAPVNSWNGTRAKLDKEINEERREDRKRSLCDNSDQGRVKHPKMNGGNGYKSNPGYNRIQEFHNAKNSWNQNNNGCSAGGPSYSRHFYNTSGKHRNRHNNGFHHKSNYHKSYSFRQ